MARNTIKWLQKPSPANVEDRSAGKGPMVGGNKETLSSFRNRNYEGNRRKQFQECLGASKTATQPPT